MLPKHPALRRPNSKCRLPQSRLVWSMCESFVYLGQVIAAQELALSGEAREISGTDIIIAIVVPSRNEELVQLAKIQKSTFENGVPNNYSLCPVSQPWYRKPPLVPSEQPMALIDNTQYFRNRSFELLSRRAILRHTCGVSCKYRCSSIGRCASQRRGAERGSVSRSHVRISRCLHSSPTRS